MAAASKGIVGLRVALWALVAIVAVAAGSFYILRPAQSAGVTGALFTINSTKGGVFANADLKGTPSLVFFGFTHCEDVCPTTMAEIVALKQELGLKPEQLRTIFVTVDPKRDTPKVLSDYLAGFDPSFIGLYGDATQTAATEAAFGATSSLDAPDKDGNYEVEHTDDVFLMGRDGEYEATLAVGEEKASALAKIKRLIGG